MTLGGRHSCRLAECMARRYLSPPTVEQMKRLEAIGASRSRRTLQGVSMEEAKPKYLALDMLDLVIVSDEGAGLEQARHSMGVRMGKRVIDTVNEVFRLEYVDVYRVERETAQQARSVTKYEFEWNNSQVLLARRALSLTIGQDRLPIKDVSDAIMGFYVPDDAASILDAEMACEQVTYGDCEEFIESANDYYQKVNLVNR